MAQKALYDDGDVEYVEHPLTNTNALDSSIDFWNMDTNIV